MVAEAVPDTIFAMEVEPCPCPLCGADNPEATPYKQDPFEVKRCGSCRVWYLSPRLTAAETNKLYQSDDYFGGSDAGYTDYDQQEESLRTTFRRFLRALADRNTAEGSLLEIGCGPGYLLDEARAYFDQCVGVEPSAAARESAARRSGAKIFRCVEELPQDFRFDVIVATHVIEHILDPVAFTQRLMTHLEPGGKLVLAAPHMGSLFRKVMGRRWPSFKYPEHVTFFDGETLVRLLERVGLSDVQEVPYPHSFPLSLVLEKLGLKSPAIGAKISVTLPATTICCMGRKAVGAV